jgi:serine/threonine-protein kinase HipA
LRCADSNLDRERWSYLLLADAVRKFSLRPADDCLELYRRMIFNALVTNDDDHPRNHGLILTERGWRLSPAFDLIPAPRTSRTRTLAMTIGEQGRVATASNLLSACDRFGLGGKAAKKEIDRMVAAAKAWRRILASAGVDRRTAEKIASAFLPEGFFDSQAEPAT